MKNLERKIEEKLNEILDKFNINGFDTLTNEETNFLKSFKDGNPADFLNYLEYKTYTDDNSYFIFTLENIEKDTYNDCVNMYGTLTIATNLPEQDSHTPMIYLTTSGYFSVFEGDTIFPEFNYKDIHTLWDYIKGFEYEFDTFCDMILRDNEDML